MWFHDRDWRYPPDRQKTRDEMRAAGIAVPEWKGATEATPAMRAQWDESARLRRESEQRRAEASAAALRLARAKLVAAALPLPPLGTYRMDQPLEDAIARCSAVNPSTGRREHYFPGDADKRPALVHYEGRLQRYPWGNHSLCNPAAVRRWAEGFTDRRTGELVQYPRRGLHCGESGVLVWDFDLKNTALGGCWDERAEEFYADFTREQLEEAHAWQCALAALMLEASDGNYAASPGGGLHVFFSCPEPIYAPTGLTAATGSIFEWPVGFCETKSGEGYVICYERFGEGRLRPVPKLIAAHAKSASRG